MRRILSHIKYELPDEPVRQKLWMHYLVNGLPLIGEKSKIVNELKKIEGITGSDISAAVLKTAVKVAANQEYGIRLDDLISEIEKIKLAKEAVEQGDFKVTTRKVSEEYVKEKIGTGGIIHGDN